MKETSEKQIENGALTDESAVKTSCENVACGNDSLVGAQSFFDKSSAANSESAACEHALKAAADGVQNTTTNAPINNTNLPNGGAEGVIDAKNARSKAATIFSAKNITRMAVFTALAVVLYLWVKFPLPFAFPSFLDMQFSELPALLAGFMMGPVYGCIVIILKCVIKMPMSSTACVGELADILIGITCVLTATLYYKFHRTKKGALIGLSISVLSSTAMAILANAVILVPLYLRILPGGWDTLLATMSPLFPSITVDSFYGYYLGVAVLPFNLLRSLIVATLTFLLYKRLGRLFDLMFQGGRKAAIKNGGSGELNDNLSERSTSEKQTMRIAYNLAKTFTGGETVLLEGELGAGKTVFCKGIAKAMKISDDVLSPTFTLMNNYRGDKLSLYHYDAYRLSCADEATETGILQYLGRSDCVCVVEWWKNIVGADFGDKVYKVNINYIGAEEREVRIERIGA